MALGVPCLGARSPRETLNTGFVKRVELAKTTVHKVQAKASAPAAPL